VISPNQVHLTEVMKNVNPNINVSAQNCSVTGKGAFTGEISLEHLKDLGVNWTLTGHSERRHNYKEDSDLIGRKTKRAVDFGLNVIACIGERLEDRQTGNTMDVINDQLRHIKSIYFFHLLK